MADIHSFNVEDAKKFGILESILLYYIKHWIEYNRANDKHFHDGKYWTYNSIKAFQELFPYVSTRQIEKAINNLKAANVIEVGNYNEKPFDRTCWYTLTDFYISQNGEMHFTCGGNPISPVGGTNTNYLPINNKKNNKEKDSIDKELIEMISNYSEDVELQDLLKEWIIMRTKKKKPTTEKALSLAFGKLDKLSNGEDKVKRELVSEAILNCWQSFFITKNNNYSSNTTNNSNSNTSNTNKSSNFQKIRASDYE